MMTDLVWAILGFSAFALLVIFVAKVLDIDPSPEEIEEERKERDSKRRRDELAIALSAYDRLGAHEPHSHAAEALRAKIVRLASGNPPPSDDQSRKQ